MVIIYYPPRPEQEIFSANGLYRGGQHRQQRRERRRLGLPALQEEVQVLREYRPLSSTDYESQYVVGRRLLLHAPLFKNNVAEMKAKAASIDFSL